LNCDLICIVHTVMNFIVANAIQPYYNFYCRLINLSVVIFVHLIQFSVRKMNVNVKQIKELKIVD